MKQFNVINFDFTKKEFVSYDIIPYLVHCYKEKKGNLTTFEEFKKFIEDESMYQWWARCEYEIVLSPWPYLSSPSERYIIKPQPNVPLWIRFKRRVVGLCK